MKALLEYIDSKKNEMFEFLERLVNIDSGSYDKAGVDQVGDVLAERLATLDFAVQRNPQKEYGDHVIALNDGRLVFEGPPSGIDDQRFKEIYGQDAERIG